MFHCHRIDESNLLGVVFHVAIRSDRTVSFQIMHVSFRTNEGSSGAIDDG